MHIWKLTQHQGVSVHTCMTSNAQSHQTRAEEGALLSLSAMTAEQACMLGPMSKVYLEKPLTVHL